MTSTIFIAGTIALCAVCGYMAYLSQQLTRTKRLIEYEDDSIVYIHNKTGNRYLLLHFGKMKRPDTGEWCNAVVYRSCKTLEVFTRELEDFKDKFTEARNN